MGSLVIKAIELEPNVGLTMEEKNDSRRVA